MVIILRIIHALAVIATLLLITGLLVNSILDWPSRGSIDAFGYGIYFVALVLISFFAFVRFRQSSFRLAAVLFLFWFVLFIWHGWFSWYSPFRLHEILARERDYYYSYARIFAAALIWIGLFAIFPMLRLWETKRLR